MTEIKEATSFQREPLLASGATTTEKSIADSPFRLLLGCICGYPFTVDTSTTAIVTHFGKFDRVAGPGLHNLACCCIGYEKVAGLLSMRVQQLDVQCTTKTLDNVFVRVDIAIQFMVMPGRERDAYFKLSNPRHQIESFVFDAIRSEVPQVTLDSLFTVKDQIAIAVKTQIGVFMSQYGYEILATPITDIDPDRGVKQAMNEINRQERLKKAANDKGEAAKILSIKEAEARAAKIRIEAAADADAKELAGQGLSRQRQAIVDGLAKSVQLFTEGVDGVNSSTVMDMIMITQYFDTMKDIGASSRLNTIFIPHQPGALSDLSSQLRQGVLEATAVQGVKDAPAVEANYMKR